jgi:hypothetical protein
VSAALANKQSLKGTKKLEWPYDYPMHNKFYICSSIFFMTLALFMRRNEIEAEEVISRYNDPIGRYNFVYPSDWKLYYDNNNDVILLLPMDNQSKGNYTSFQIRTMISYNVSLQAHVFRNINYYIDKYAIGDFILFSLGNLTDNVVIDGVPAYKLEYNVRMNDKFQSPVSILEYFVVYNNNLFKIQFTQGGFGINSINRNMIDSIIQSIEFE